MKGQGHMDRGASKPNRWDWLPAFMPGVARQIRDKRREWGDAHVNECWRRGVVLGEPGWFLARESTITVGAWDDPEMLALAATVNGTQSLLIMRNPGAAHGA